MKNNASLILAGACIVLAVVILLTRAGSAPTPTTGRAASPAMPLVSDPDIGLFDRPMGDLRLDSIPLGQAIQILADRAKVGIFADWTALREGNRIDQQTPVRVNLANATLENALDAIMQGLRDKDHVAPIYAVDQGKVIITAGKKAGEFTATAYINIRTMVEEMLAYADLDWEADTKNQRRSVPTRDDMIARVVRLITDTVDPDAWQDAGGTVGSMREIGGVLVIVNTPKAIREIRVLLERLRVSLHANDFPQIANDAARSPVRIDVGKDGTLPLFTETINIRQLLLKLQQPGSLSQQQVDGPSIDPFKVVQVCDLVMEMVSRDSWKNAGGEADIREFSGLLTITQTADNLAIIHRFLAQLYQAASTDPRSPVPPPASTAPANDAATTRPGGTQRAFINIRPLISDLEDGGAALPGSPRDHPAISKLKAVDRIEDFIQQNIAPASWRATPGNGKIDEVGGIIIIEQTPENIQAVRAALQNLHAAISRHDFYPATQPASK